MSKHFIFLFLCVLPLIFVGCASPPPLNSRWCTTTTPFSEDQVAVIVVETRDGWTQYRYESSGTTNSLTDWGFATLYPYRCEKAEKSK